jgi:acyl carrier protein
MYSIEIAKTLEQVQSILAYQLCLPLDAIAASAALEDDLNMDSLELAEACIALEETFDLEIDQVRKFRTVFDIAEFIGKRVPVSAGYACA